MRQYSLAEVESNLSQLVNFAMGGEEIILASEGKPVVRLVPVIDRTSVTAMTKDGIIAKIEEGIKNAYHDAVRFSYYQEDMITTEYFYVVYIAKSLYSECDWGSYKISIEHPTEHFFSESFPFCKPCKKKMHFRAKRYDSKERSGRIDIAIKKGDLSFCAIEVKGVNQSKQLLVSDIRRNLEMFVILDDNVGNSAVDLAFLVSLHKYKKWDDVSVAVNLKRLKCRFSHYLNELECNTSGTRSTVHAFVVTDEASNDDERRHLILGNIVAIERV